MQKKSHKQKNSKRALMRDLVMIFIGVVFALLLSASGIIDYVVSVFKDYYIIASFVSGIFFTSVFTLAPASITLIHIAQNSPISGVVFWGGLGAMCGDLVLFLFIKDRFAEDLKNVIVRSSGQGCGEYVFFPVKDDQIFLPGDKDYDVSPHKLDLLCQNIRTIEKTNNWKTKRILIIGDKFHKSYVRSEDQTSVIKKSEDVISISSVASKYENVSIIDPSDVVIKKILEIAKGRKIVFRATKEGIKEYKSRFYDRLKKLGYRSSSTKKGVLTIGYDIFEDQTEQQTLSRKIDGYLPVVLSKNVRDALIRNGYKENEFLYVPELVLEALTKEAVRQ
jgi:hypothetical protein